MDAEVVSEPDNRGAAAGGGGGGVRRAERVQSESVLQRVGRDCGFVEGF